MGRLLEYLAYGACFDDVARVHYGHTVTQLCDYAEVVRDQQNAKVIFPNEIVEQA